MPVIKCPVAGCTYETPDVDAAVIAQLLNLHKVAHPEPAAVPVVAPREAKQRAPKIEPPKISEGSSEETWNSWHTRWMMFKRGTILSEDEKVQQLFQCCDQSLGDAVLQGHPDAVEGNEDVLLAVIKKLAVTPVPRVVRRNDLLNLKQDHGEKTRSFVARIRGKATTCGYKQECCGTTCNVQTDFTEMIVKDVLINGLNDEEIKKEVLGWADVDDKTVEEALSFIEGKEMARDAMKSSDNVAPISSYKSRAKASNMHPASCPKVRCENCNVEMDKFVWNPRMKQMIEPSLCKPCWTRAKNSQKPKKTQKKTDPRYRKNDQEDETSALLIGSLTVAESTESNVAEHPFLEKRPIFPAEFVGEIAYSRQSMVSSLASGPCPVRSGCSASPVTLDHHIFDSKNGWRKSESMAHPTLRLLISTDSEDYNRMGIITPDITPSYETAVTDTGAMSCLWGLLNFYRAGFKDSDLIPVKRTMVAANKEPINISGAILLRVSGKDNLGDTYTAAVMAYVSPDTTKFYLSREALIQLYVIPKNFPRIGAASSENSAIASRNGRAKCGCLPRTLPPPMLEKLPFACSPENNAKMKKFLGDYYASSTFNTCTHQGLEGITGPELKFHLKPDASFDVATTPAMIPLHDLEEVRKQLNSDVALGVLEEVPYGQPRVCCHRMVIVRKPDGGIRRTVDMSSLNKQCLREPHHVPPPFQQARSIPRNTWKSVTDAWNGFHSVPLRKEDRHLTTFITPFGSYQYKVAPQGAAASGDAYTRRYDEIIADVERKTKCVDDTAQWDDDLEEHWWRMIKFLDLVGRNGVVLNYKKFQFAQREIDFAGFKVTETSVKPLEKYLTAIANFPTPKRTTDIRSWFGLVHQVSHYNQLTELMAPFKPFLSPRTKFDWSDELETAFQKSKLAIVEAIREGVEIFDPSKLTCLRTDYSDIGLGYFLSQKHCSCKSIAPGCCSDGWRITLAGSRFLKPAETRYAPIEGEALAIAWSLEQTKYFTQGCNNLIVITDHKPLVGLFEKTTLDEITNPRLFALKQRTMLWRFKTLHRPGKENMFADAASRYPTEHSDDEFTLSEVLCGIMVEEDESNILSVAAHDSVRAVTWDLVREETAKDMTMQQLAALVNTIFPQDKQDLPSDLSPYWPIRNNLYMVDGVILMGDQVVIPQTLRHRVTHEHILSANPRILIPPVLRKEVIRSLHSAHQGISSMNERAKAGIYWPGITSDIKKVRENCNSCNRNMPSQARPTPIPPLIPTTPFEAIACDFFHYIGKYYFVAADRLSGWVETQQVKVGTNEAGAQGLCAALRRLMVTFGVPCEISSDGGPEFIAEETAAFFRRWGIQHRLSSAYLPSSNGRAELAVKTTKRLIMDNVGPDGNLNTDQFVRALLMYRNTPDPGCKLSPAQVLLGRPLRDSLPYINKQIMAFNNPQVNSQWRDAWEAKEDALRTRYVKTLENLSEHSRTLPPLRHGDQVLLQNQRGRFPKKWDHSGMIVETKPNDQYVVRVSGSRRLTLRNRRFLRKFTPHESIVPQTPVSGQCLGNMIRPPASKPIQISPKTANAATAEPPLPESASQVKPHSVSDDTPTRTPQSEPHRSFSQQPRRLSFGDFQNVPCESGSPSESTPPVTFASPPPTEGRSPVRSKRERTQRTCYDASSGTYKPPSSVPDDV